MNNCTSTQDGVVDYPLGIEDLGAQQALDLSVYPNPSSGTLRISVRNGSMGKYQFAVYSIQGSVVHEEEAALKNYWSTRRLEMELSVMTNDNLRTFLTIYGEQKS